MQSAALYLTTGELWLCCPKTQTSIPPALFRRSVSGKRSASFIRVQGFFWGNCLRNAHSDYGQELVFARQIQRAPGPTGLLNNPYSPARPHVTGRTARRWRYETTPHRVGAEPFPYHAASALKPNRSWPRYIYMSQEVNRLFPRARHLSLLSKRHYFVWQ